MISYKITYRHEREKYHRSNQTGERNIMLHRQKVSIYKGKKVIFFDELYSKITIWVASSKHKILQKEFSAYFNSLSKVAKKIGKNKTFEKFNESD